MALRPPAASGPRRLFAAMAFAIAAFGSAASSGADDGAAALRILFAQGHALEQAGRWADALQRFEEIARARLTPQVEFHIALCQDRLGRLLVAEHHYRHARDRARGVAPVVVGESIEHLADLDARMPRVIVSVTGAASGVRVFLDGAPITPGATVRVDPGPHLAVAVREGVTVAAASFATQERRTKLVPLVVLPRR